MALASLSIASSSKQFVVFMNIFSISSSREGKETIDVDLSESTNLTDDFPIYFVSVGAAATTDYRRQPTTLFTDKVDVNV